MDNRDLIRCTSCNHLQDMHGDKGCNTQELGNNLNIFKKCACKHTNLNMPTYSGATSYFIAPDPAEEAHKAKLNTVKFQAEMLRVSLSVAENFHPEDLTGEQKRQLITAMQDVRDQINSIIEQQRSR